MADIKKNILVIEDDSMIRTFLVDKIEKAGLVPFQAGTTAEAWDALKKNAIDFIVLDIILPQVDGLQFLKELKKDTTHGATPVMILSNLSHEDEVARAKKLGIIDYVIKAEKTPAEIVNKIKEYLTQTKSEV